LKEFYSRPGQYMPWQADAAGRQVMWRARLRCLRRHVRSGRLLDVGAGDGHFLSLARRHFEVLGTEISSEAVRVAKARFGIDLVLSDLDDETFLARRAFDVITLFHVLEHVPTPSRLIRRCHRLLASGGWLIAALPNESPIAWYKARHGGRALFRRLCAGQVRAIRFADSTPFPALDLAGAPPGGELHLSHFRPECVRALLVRHGFRIVRLGSDPYFTSTGLRRLRDALESGFWSAVRRLTGIHGYETQFVVARKE
jgi:SAM-dependent methyltransferase